MPNNISLESNRVSPSTGSHPVIRFKQVPIVSGPLSHFEPARSRILQDVVEKTKGDLGGVQPDVLLGEALYSERRRLKQKKWQLFTFARLNRDRKVWHQVQNGLLKPAAEVDRNLLLDKVIRHYAEEIGGHFDPRIYHLSTRAVPWGFSWFLNAASVRRFLPWGMSESLMSRLHILGDVPALKKLADRGTILLAPTHQSNIDSVLIGYVIYLMSLPPFAYGAGLNLFSNPILNFFMSRLGAYTIDREKKNEIYKQALKNYSTRILSEGIHSIFFPGGGRSRSGAIENKVKLGLLGTALDAQIEGLLAGQPKNKLFIVPMVTSYHFILEASSLIEDYLSEAGKHRFMSPVDESWQPTKVIAFFWKLFASQSAVTVRIGKALDVFGNLVDEEGRSIGPNKTIIDPTRWLTTRGQLKKEPQRDQEYTLELGARLSDRFHKENTVVTSHLVAFSYFETLRSKYCEFDLFRFLRLSLDQRSMQYVDFLESASLYHQKLVDLESRGGLFLAAELKTSQTDSWVKDGVKHLGLLHDVAVVKVQKDVIWTEDMNLLYYYRNRLAGYGLSFLAQSTHIKNQFTAGQNDSKGFLV